MQQQQLGSMLLRLWRGAFEKQAGEFRDYALSEVKRLIPFDSCAWGTGRWIDGKPLVHHIHLQNLPGDFVESWLTIQHEYRMTRDVTAHSNRTFNVDMAREYAGTDTYNTYCKKHGIEHILGTGCVNPESGLVTMMVLHRRDIDQPFSEQERSLKETLFPHLQEAARTNWLLDLQGVALGHAQSFEAIAVSDRVGLLHYAAPAFVELMRAEWPGWEGPFLPERLRETQPGEQYDGHAIVIRTSGINELTSLRARARVAADRLSERELQIAQRMSQGEDYKAIALELSLSPATVKTHTHRIYLKLGINDKAKLAAELRKMAF